MQSETKKQNSIGLNGDLSRDPVVAAVQVVHLHSGTLHTLEGDEEFCLHGDGWFSSGEKMVS